jgi:hypothetical protein
MDDTPELSFRGITIRKRLKVALTVTVSQIHQRLLDIIFDFVLMPLLAVGVALQRLRGLPPSIDEL